MRKRTRLVTTAGVTVMGFAAMSGMAQADTGGLGLTGPLGKSVSGLVKQKTSPTHRTQSSSRSGLHLNLPLRVRLKVPPTSGKAKSPVVDVKAPVKAAIDPAVGHVKLALTLCVSLPEECGRPNPGPQPSPTPPGPPEPPSPPSPPGTNPPVPPALPALPVGNVPASSGSLAVAENALPLTGGPIGTLAFLGAAAVLTGAAGVAGSRLRLRRAS
jgi:hypothetical protein